VPRRPCPDSCEEKKYEAGADDALQLAIGFEVCAELLVFVTVLGCHHGDGRVCEAMML